MEPGPTPTFTAKRPIRVELTHPTRERRGEMAAEGGLTMRAALRETLRHHLTNDARVVLYGEDIEDPKGDVFGVTKGLSTRFPGRVRNAPLSESTIVGTSIGRALAGERPVAFLQFADFLPLAYNQLVAELGGHYGLCWFVNDGRALLPSAPEDMFFHVGNGKDNRRTVLAVIPSLDLVAVVGTHAAAYDVTRGYKSEPVQHVNEWIGKIMACFSASGVGLQTSGRRQSNRR